MTTDRFMKKKEAAEYLGVTVYTIDRYVKKRGMPFYKIGNEPRYKATEIDEWAKQYKKKAS